MLSRAQFASVVGANEKWVENTARLLDQSLKYTHEEARHLRLVRLLSRDFAIAIPNASHFAAAAFEAPPESRDVELVNATSGDAALSLDLARFHSGFIAALSAAIHHGGKRQAGRKARHATGSTAERLQSAAEYGVDIPMLTSALRRSPAERLARLDANADSVRALREATRRAAR